MARWPRRRARGPRAAATAGRAAGPGRGRPCPRSPRPGSPRAWAGSVIIPTAAVGMPGLLADPCGERDLVPGAGGDVLVRAHPAARDVDEVHSEVAQPSGHHDAVVEGVPAGDPVGRTDPHQQRAVLGPGRPDRGDHLAQQSGTTGEVAAVPVGPVVGQRGEELVEQVSVSCVHLHGVEARVQGALRWRPRTPPRPRAARRSTARAALRSPDSRCCSAPPSPSRPRPPGRCPSRSTAGRSTPCSRRAPAGSRRQRPGPG